MMATVSQIKAGNDDIGKWSIIMHTLAPCVRTRFCGGRYVGLNGFPEPILRD